MPTQFDPVDTVARTLYGEARGCGATGMKHVASVICNRVSHISWWGTGFPGVCMQPYQFSCWLPGDPNLPKLLAVTESDPDFRVALSIANVAVARQLPDLTYGADSYYALAMRTPPAWAAKAQRTTVDGWHAFYRTIAAAPPGTHPDVRVVSIHAPVVTAPPAAVDQFMARDRVADDLNADELQRLNPTPTE